MKKLSSVLKWGYKTVRIKFLFILLRGKNVGLVLLRSEGSIDWWLRNLGFEKFQESVFLIKMWRFRLKWRY